MREILYRAKRLDNHEFAYGSVLRLNLRKTFICDGTVWIGTLTPSKYEVDPETVDPFIWLTDLENKKVFVNDIILIGGRDKCIVNFQRGKIFARSERSKATYSWNELSSGKYQDFVIIGNAHDNQE